jgi:hypothetical protein
MRQSRSNCPALLLTSPASEIVNDSLPEDKPFDDPLDVVDEAPQRTRRNRRNDDANLAGWLGKT